MRQGRTKLSGTTTPAAMTDARASFGGGARRTRMLGAAVQHWEMVNAQASLKGARRRAIHVTNAAHHHTASHDALCIYSDEKHNTTPI